jgi:hypothetical protein
MKISKRLAGANAIGAMIVSIVLCAGAAHARDLRSSAQTLGLTQQPNLPATHTTVATSSVTAPQSFITTHPAVGQAVIAAPASIKICRPHPDPKHGVQWICYQ